MGWDEDSLLVTSYGLQVTRRDALIGRLYGTKFKKHLNETK